MTDEEKAIIIANALETRVGRLHLARAMVMPIARSLGTDHPYLKRRFFDHQLIMAHILDWYDASFIGKCTAYLRKKLLQLVRPRF